MDNKKLPIIIAAAVVIIFALYLFIHIHMLIKQHAPAGPIAAPEQQAQVNEPSVYSLPANISRSDQTAENMTEEQVLVKNTDERALKARQERRVVAMHQALAAENAAVENPEEKPKGKSVDIPTKKPAVFPTRQERESWKAKGVVAY